MLAAGIVSDPAGCHVYVSVRGADVLVHLAVGPGGLLTDGAPARIAWTADWPQPTCVS